MNHIQLHEKLSEMLLDLQEGRTQPNLAREYFNGAGKLIANCKNELIASSMGASVDIPLLGLKSGDINPRTKRIFTE